MRLLFLPWIGLQNDIQFGNILFWNYAEGKEKYITDKSIMNKCDNIFSRFKSPVDHENPLNICVASVKTKNKMEIEVSEKHFERLNNAIICITFVYLARLYMEDKDPNIHVNSDAFQVWQMDFDDIGFIFAEGRRRDYYSWGSSREFYRPGYIQSPREMRIENDLLKALQMGFLNRKARKEFNRILRAMEHFNYSNSHSPSVFLESKIILSCTAYEILLEIGFSGEKKKRIMEKFGQVLGQDKGERKTIRKKAPKMGPHTKNEWWIYDYYDLRNAIVHGDKVGYSKYSSNEMEYQRFGLRKRVKVPHLYISGKYFRKCVINKLEKLNLYKNMWQEAKEQSEKALAKHYKNKA